MERTGIGAVSGVYESAEVRVDSYDIVGVEELLLFWGAVQPNSVIAAAETAHIFFTIFISYLAYSE